MNKLKRTDNGSVLFECPGCNKLHVVYLTTPGRPHWEFNDDMVNPTFSPSIHVYWERNGKPHICHSFVKNGQIQYLGDCTHSMAGKTVTLPDWSE